MKESWRYYEYLRRWGLFLLLSLALGALAGFGYHIQQDLQASFKATALVSFQQADQPLIQLRVVSENYSDPSEAVSSILSNVKLLENFANGIVDIDVDNFSIEGRRPVLLWKPVVLGSVIGGLLALGAAFVWDDAGAYLKHRK